MVSVSIGNLRWMVEHNPIEFTAELGAKLATRSRHVCFFLGAGVSKACGLPDVAGLEEAVLSDLAEPDRTALKTQLQGRNLEQALSRLRRIAALIGADQQIDGLSGEDATALDASICAQVVARLDSAGADLSPVLGLAAWIARSDYRAPVEVFTVNYDLLVEEALERYRVPYFDGFVGNLRARFQTELVEASPRDDRDFVPRFFARLWKLHGSTNWEWAGDEIVRLGSPVGSGVAAAIYPSDAKYEESRRVPFVVLQDRFRRALHQPETLVVIAGYSFQDEHLNEMMFDAATRRERSEFVTFCFNAIPDALAERAARLPNFQVVAAKEAILGGIRGDWVPGDQPVPAGVWESDRFCLGDFRHLGAYLARSATREPERDPLLTALLTRFDGSGGGSGGGQNG